MTKTEEHKNGVIGITNLARTYEPEIGIYQEHFINENFGFSVRLSDNGAISMSREIAQDYEAMPNSISEERIEKVAKSFRKI